MSFKGFSVGIQNDSEKIKQLVLQSKQIADDLASLQAQIQELSTSKTSDSGGLPVVGEDNAAYSLDLVNCTSLYPLVVDKNKRKIQSIESVPNATHATSADTATSADSALESGNAQTLNGHSDSYFQTAFNKNSFNAYFLGSQSISATTWTKITINTENFDNNTKFSTTIYRYVPVDLGTYSISGMVKFEFTGSMAARTFYVELHKNGARMYGVGNAGYWAYSTDTKNIYNFSGDFKVTSATDYFEIYVYSTVAATVREAGLSGHRYE